MSAPIPVFVSAPTALTSEQQASYDAILGILNEENLQHRALGRTDFGIDFPLKEVFAIARHCSGGVILGYSQMRAKHLEIKPNTPEAKVVADQPLPTPWNNLEAGILFGLRLPLMVFREEGVTGGVFDNGVSDAFIQRLPLGVPSQGDEAILRTAIKTWAANVRHRYRTY